MILGSGSKEGDKGMPRLKRGGLESFVWGLFIDKRQTQHLNLTVYKNCHVRVNHPNKLEAAKTHLNKYKVFRAKMNEIEDAAQTDWYA